MLLNLIGNVVKFTERGTVSLTITQEAGNAASTSLRFSVADTGIGIPVAKLERVFERFTQADTSTTRRFGGSGLGLTISKRLVELMGGRIWIESDEGKGSVFSFTVSFKKWVGSKLHQSVLVEVDQSLPLLPLRILLAEDSADNCLVTMAYLENTPYQVEIAETGAIACDMFMAQPYDLVLMDRQMPVMDGLTATQKIRAWEKENDRNPTPIFALTASALKGDREMCMAAGCTAFLTKPIKQAVLLQGIRGLSPGLDSSYQNNIGLKLALAERTESRIALQRPAYLQNCRKNVVELLDALNKSDFETVIIIGHNMSGTGRMFGFQEITDLEAALELSAKSLDTSTLRKWVNQLAGYLEECEIS